MLAIKSTMADIVRRARSKGMSVNEIAELTGRDPCTIWRWETNKSVKFVYDEGVERLLERVEELEVSGEARKA